MSFATEEMSGTSKMSPLVATVTAGISSTHTVQLYDQKGEEINLSAVTTTVTDPYVLPGTPITAATLSDGIIILVTEYRGKGYGIGWNNCSVNTTTNEVTFSIDDWFDNPGIYTAVFLFITNKAVVRTTSGNVEVLPNYLSPVMSSGPITISEVRLWLRDSGSGDNFLLDETEFKDGEVIAAITRAVDVWNGTPPILDEYEYTVNTFPARYRSQWLDLAGALLKGMAATWYLRNSLQYSAAGLSVNDKEKWQAYQVAAAEKMNEYRAWVTMTKVQLNSESCYGVV